MKRILLGLTVGVSFAFVIVSATARDLDGRYADSPLHDWFNHLASLVIEGVYLRVQHCFQFKAFEAVIAKGMTRETRIFELVGAST